MEAQTVEEQTVPATADIVGALANVSELSDDGGFDRLIIMQSGTHEYAYRIYRTRDKDYEGGVLLLDS